MQDFSLLSLWCQIHPALKLQDWLWARDLLLAGVDLKDLSKFPQPPKKLIYWSGLGERRAELEDRRGRLMNEGIGLCYPGHPHYPSSYLGLHQPPLCLLLKGRAEQLSSRGLAVVGSRNLHALSQNWMQNHLGSFLSQCPCTLFSGGARGVDQEAHKIALRKSCPTVVFIPSGLNRLYPSELARWQDAVLEGGGLFVSEYWLDQEMRPFHFRQRNRMIAQAGDLLVVVEARCRSGSLMTAGLAADQGREVAVVPGHPELIQMRGGLELIKSGAQLLVDGEDLKCLWLSMSQTMPMETNI